jgi:hypothetical protein
MILSLAAGARPAQATPGALAAMAGLSVQEVHDELLLTLSPKTFRQTKFLRFSGEAGREVYLLGTLHSRHLTTGDYSLLHLQAVQAHLKPDLLLVESRPEELARDNWADGPVEMPFASLTARATGVDVAGFDWWSMNADHEINSDRREDRMFENIRKDMASHRRILILTGYGHIEGFARRLAASGYRRARFSAAEKDALFDTQGLALRFPRGMTHYVQKRIETDRSTLQLQTDSFWRSRLAAAIADRRRFLQTISAVGEPAP